MKTKLILLDTPIIVSDEKIKNGDAIYEDISGIFSPYEEGDVVENPRKIIAGIEGLPSIDWNGLEEEFGWVDVDLSSMCYYDRRNPDFSIKEEYGYDREEIENTGDFARKGCACDNCFYGRSLLTEQIIKLKSLNDKKFSLKDVSHLDFLFNRLKNVHGENENYDYMIKFKEIIQSLQQPKVFDIEIEVTNNSIKILRKI